MTTTTLCPPNAILFVFDRTNHNVSVPEYIDGQLIASTDTCLSVGTQDAVDGDTTISLERLHKGASANIPHKVFTGRLRTPGRKIAVVTSEGQIVLEQDVEGEIARVEIWTDDLRNPARVVVLAT